MLINHPSNEARGGRSAPQSQYSRSRTKTPHNLPTILEQTGKTGKSERFELLKSQDWNLSNSLSSAALHQLNLSGNEKGEQNFYLQDHVEKSLVSNGVVQRNLIYFVAQFILVAIQAMLYAIQSFSDHTECVSGVTGKDLSKSMNALFTGCFLLHTIEFCNCAFFSPYF